MKLYKLTTWIIQQENEAIYSSVYCLVYANLFLSLLSSVFQNSKNENIIMILHLNFMVLIQKVVECRFKINACCGKI